MSIQTRSYFFLDAGTQTVDGKYRRLGSDHKPSSATFVDLLDSFVHQTEDTAYTNVATGGTTGQVLTKNSATDGDYSWSSASSHSQNTDTGTNQATWIINSGGSTATITTASLTSNRVFTLPDAAGTFALVADLHTQNTDTGTTQDTWVINSGGFTGTLDATTLTGNREFILPDTDGTLALTTDTHTQNTDTGTTQSTWIINSGGSTATLQTSSLTANRIFTFPDKAGTFAMTNDVQDIFLQFEEVSLTPGVDISKIKFARAGTISVQQREGFTSTNAGSYSTNSGGSYTTMTTSTSFAVSAGDTVWFRSTNSANASVYSSSNQGLVTLGFTPS